MYHILYTSYLSANAAQCCEVGTLFLTYVGKFEDQELDGLPKVTYLVGGRTGFPSWGRLDSIKHKSQCSSSSSVVEVLLISQCTPSQPTGACELAL